MSNTTQVKPMPYETMKSSILTSFLFLSATLKEADSRLLRWHRGGPGGHGMMQEGGAGGMMHGDGEMMMNDKMMMGDCHEMMENGGMMGDSKQDESSCPMNTIHKLLSHRDEITRHIKDTPKGVHTQTFSDSPEINTWIRQHVQSMIELTHSGHRIRDCDGLFHELYENAANLNLECHDDNESGGVQCKFRAEGDCAVGLAQAHARVVSAFLKNGWDEVHRDHADMVPDSCFEAST
jgi:hypothetical protein